MRNEWQIKLQGIKPKPFRKTNLVIGEPFEFSDFYNKKLDKDTLNTAGEILIKKLKDLKLGLENMKMEKSIIKKLKKN